MDFGKVAKYSFTFVDKLDGLILFARTDRSTSVKGPRIIRDKRARFKLPGFENSFALALRKSAKFYFKEKEEV